MTDDRKMTWTFNGVVVCVRFVHFDGDWDWKDTHYPLLLFFFPTPIVYWQQHNIICLPEWPQCFGFQYQKITTVFLVYAVYSAELLQFVVNFERLLSPKRGLVRDSRAEYLDGFISSIWVVRFVKFDTMSDRSVICPDVKSHTAHVSLPCRSTQMRLVYRFIQARCPQIKIFKLGRTNQIFLT